MKILPCSRRAKKHNRADSISSKALDPKHLTLSKRIDSWLCKTTQVLYSSDLDEIIVIGYMRRDENYQINTYDGKNFTLHNSVEAHKAAIYKAILIPKGLLFLVTISADQTMKIWSLSGLSLVSQIRMNYIPQDICVNPNIPAVILVGKSYHIKSYCPKTGSLLGEMITESVNGFSSCIYLSEKNVVAAGVYDQQVIHFIDCRTGLTINTVKAENHVDSIIGMQLIQSQYLVAASVDLICVWDIQNLSQPKMHLQIELPLKKVSSFHVNEEYDAIFVTTRTPVIDIYRLSDGTFMKFLPTKMQKCSSLTLAHGTRQLLVADNSEGAISVFTYSDKMKLSCQTCNIF